MVTSTRFDGRTVKGLTAEQETKQRFEILFHIAPIPMTISALPNQDFTDVNDAFLKTLGFARDDVFGKTSADLNLFVHPNCMLPHPPCF